MRPLATFNEFVGQRGLVRSFLQLIHGARVLGEPVPHSLVIGPAGIGKSRLVRAIAREIANDKTVESIGNLKRVIAGRDVSARDVVDILVSLQAYDVLFLDEIHSLASDAAEVLLLAIDEQLTFGIADDGTLDRTVDVSLPAFTLIGATNMPGRMLLALRSRLQKFEFSDYSVREIRVIADRVAESHGIDVTGHALNHLAERARGSPRAVGQMLELLRLAFPRTQLDLPAVRAFLSERGIDERGLDPSQRRALQILAATPGYALSHEMLTSRLGADSAYVRIDVEAVLIQLGLIEISARGKRRLAPAGIDAIRECATEAEHGDGNPGDGANDPEYVRTRNDDEEVHVDDDQGGP